MLSLSVIIPTHRRPQILRECLRRLANQTIADDLEVIVVSDGPDPEVAQLCTQAFRFPLSAFRYLEIPKSQQGIARNFGVKHATAPYTLFIGDDIFLEPDACERHLAAHDRIAKERTPLAPATGNGTGESEVSAAVLGFTTWDPAAGITPVMQWLERSGWQFGYPMIRKYGHALIPAKRQERFTYTSHISIPTNTARRFCFREDMTSYGWEDVEWGLRLKEAGIRLYYEPDAKALHHHRITLEQSVERMKTLGQSLVALAHQVPAFQKQISAIRQVTLRVHSLLPTMNGMHCRAFLQGMWKAMRNG